MVELGYLSGVHGVKGWFKVFSYTDPKENIFKCFNWLILHQGSWLDFKLEQSKLTGKGLIAKLSGINDRNCAEKYLKARVAINSSELPKLKEGEYYWRDLVGLYVTNKSNQSLGVVKSIMQTGANDVLMIVDEDKRILIPYIRDMYILDIDLQNQLITVDWDYE